MAEKNSAKKKLNKVALEMTMVKFVTTEEKIEQLEVEKNKLKDEIKDQLLEAGEQKYLLEIDPADSNYTKTIRCSFSIATKARVNYNVAKVKEILGKKTFNKIANKQIELDYPMFVEMAKKYGIPHDEAMKCLSITESIDNSKLQQMYDTGEIDIKSLKGAFTIDKSLYLAHRRVK